MTGRLSSAVLVIFQAQRKSMVEISTLSHFQEVAGSYEKVSGGKSYCQVVDYRLIICGLLSAMKEPLLLKTILTKSLNEFHVSS